MNKLFVIFATLLLSVNSLIAKEIFPIMIKETQTPILIDREDNILFYVRVESLDNKALTSLSVNFGDEVDYSNIKSLKLYYSGTESMQRAKGVYFSSCSYIKSYSPGKTSKANPSYSINIAEVKSPKGSVTFDCDVALFPGINYFWVSIEMKRKTPLLAKITADIAEVKLDGVACSLNKEDIVESTHRMGVAMRNAGDDGSAAYRIPGLVTTAEGSLLGVYDIRYNSSVDLQEHVDIGLSRSTDKGQTWESMRKIMKFGEYANMPLAQNGVGDPAILVDDVTGTIWAIAIWTHGMGNYRAWFNSQQGNDKTKTAQLMLVKSVDDGKSWSEPINITEQVKDESWHLLLQGPGRGITMNDGTLVFPIQYIDKDRVPNAGVMYSKDSGETWHIHNHAHTNTTEAQVVELADGELMLNMRDNRKGSRAIYTTKDLGQTWSAHSSNRSALQEPVCMASLLKVKAVDNILGKEILLFSNPNSTTSRDMITIKASLDGGKTWKESNQLLLDEGSGWGYSCLTLVDESTIGILYEGSQAHMLYQNIDIRDIVE